MGALEKCGPQARGPQSSYTPHWGLPGVTAWGAACRGLTRSTAGTDTCKAAKLHLRFQTAFQEVILGMTKRSRRQADGKGSAKAPRQ